MEKQIELVRDNNIRVVSLEKFTATHHNTVTLSSLLESGISILTSKRMVSIKTKEPQIFPVRMVLAKVDSASPVSWRFGCSVYVQTVRTFNVAGPYLGNSSTFHARTTVMPMQFLFRYASA